MRGLKTFFSSKILLASALLAFGTLGAIAPTANAQVIIGVGIQPMCSYGYYDYAPYACAPVGFYGSGYFYNGIFLGMGPWAGWGYDHGWGGHRFSGGGGGRYNGGGGEAANRAYATHGNAGHTSAVRTSGGGTGHFSGGTAHNGGARPAAGHLAPSQGAAHTSAPHAAAAHEGGGAAHEGGGAAHGGGASHGGGHGGGEEHK